MDPLFGPRARDGRRFGAPTGALGRWGRGAVPCRAVPCRAVPCRAGTRGAAAVGADARRGGRGAIKAAAAAAAGRQHHGELPGAGAVRRGRRAAAERPRARIDPAAPRPRPGTARRRRRLPGEGADRGAAGGTGEAQEQEGTALREEVRAGAHVRRRGAVRREEGGSHREALRLPPGDVVQFLPPQVPVSRGVPGQAAGSAGTDVWPPRRAGDFPQLLRPRNAARSPRVARVTPSVTSDIRGAVFFLSPAPPRPLPPLLPRLFLSVQENPGPCLGSRGSGPGSCSAVPVQTRVVPSRAGKPYWPRAVPRAARLLPRAEIMHPLPAGGAGAGGLP